MYRLLVLGGDGFVGRSFIEMQSGFADVRIVSRFPTFPGKDELVVPDIASLSEYVFDGIDIVFNCLGIAHRNDSANRDLFFEVNRDLAVILASKAKAVGVKLFVQMSSISVYGPAENIDQKTAPAPTTNYAKSKAEADTLLESLQEDGFSVLLIRPPMLYGEKAPGNMEKFIKLVKYLPILPFKDAESPRDFLFIGNFIKYVEYAMKADLHGVLILKDVHSFSTRQLAEAIIQELGLKRAIIKLRMKWLVKCLIPEYYRKLYGSLKIESNLIMENYGKLSLYNIDDALRMMIRGYKDKHMK